MQCQSAFVHNHAQFGQNPELRTLFYRLSRLLSCCIDAVFVFDGPNRAKVKRGKQVRSIPHWLTTGMQEMLDAFGFTWYTVSNNMLYIVNLFTHSKAAGDAEAELAWLNRNGQIDAVISEDSDTLVFGAPVVI